MNGCSLENNPRTDVVVRDFVECRPSWVLGKADALWEETSTRTMGTTGVRVQASGEGFVEVTLGRSYVPAGADSDRRRPADRGSDHRRWEGVGLAHEPVVAITAG